MKNVSFILPAYKRRFLKEAIDSILSQTCRELELVVVDDKSPEELYGVIKEYPWEKNCELLPDGGKKWNVNGISVRYYQNETNIGGRDLVAAWDHAMEYATGEWCVLASDDDVYQPEYLEEMMRLVKKYPKCDLFHCRPALIDADGKIIAFGCARTEFESCLEMLYSRYCLNAQQTMPDFLFRKKRYDAVGGFVQMPSAMHSDQATWAVISERNGVACSSRVLFYWRDSNINVSMRCDNVVVKVSASLLYLAWFREFVDRLSPVNEFEKIMQQILSLQFGACMVRHMRGDMYRAPLIPWLSAICKVQADASLKLRFIYDRMRKFFDVACLWRWINERCKL